MQYVAERLTGFSSCSDSQDLPLTDVNSIRKTHFAAVTNQIKAPLKNKTATDTEPSHSVFMTFILPFLKAEIIYYSYIANA